MTRSRRAGAPVGDRLAGGLLGPRVAGGARRAGRREEQLAGGARVAMPAEREHRSPR